MVNNLVSGINTEQADQFLQDGGGSIDVASAASDAGETIELVEVELDEGGGSRKLREFRARVNNVLRGQGENGYDIIEFSLEN